MIGPIMQARVPPEFSPQKVVDKNNTFLNISRARAMLKGANLGIGSMSRAPGHRSEPEMGEFIESLIVGWLWHAPRCPIVDVVALPSEKPLDRFIRSFGSSVPRGDASRFQTP